MNWSDALSFAEKGFNAWAAKDHNRKWVRKIDGTPIKNDLLVNIATAIAEAHVTAQAQPAPIAGLEPECPFCGRDPFHRIDNGIGMEAVAVTCCDLGDLFFRGARAAPSEVTLSWEEFMEIGHKIAVLRMSATQLEAHAAEQVRAEREACAAICEEWAKKWGVYSDLKQAACENDADAIRARGQV